ncbi:26S proteasome non-ATPase regulatory subunit 9 [Golovinomyces cichoracearum]|uniref:Probable 26S proteasome regulatory subunit p27 n=1 Tax=Golovinomyces cichoracearum TaxID=62708 RepID=A0A420IN82_9PEZI|nr:26S proteasome non-ATPase regulatory subunit 9 [Golovinomyces cichoracearum]
MNLLNNKFINYKMHNLHAPTIFSGQTSSTKNVSRIPNEGLTLAQLQATKENLEAELRALGSVLDSHHVDMKTSLLTPDGYPRADLDVAQIRTTRARINYLLNDLKDLMSVIEERIHEHFAQLTAEGTTEDLRQIKEQPATNIPSKILDPTSSLSPPFAKVNGVVEGSPAASAGLQVGDVIRNFSYVNFTNHDGLRRLSECVAGNENRDISVVVSRQLDSRQRQELNLTLRPNRNWGGKGLLGCHILPY